MKLNFYTISSRLQEDFQLSMMSTLCLCGIFGITPFAIYRFVNGDTLAGVVDFLVLSGIVAIVAYAWRTGDTRNGGRWLSIIVCAGAVAVANAVGITGAFWLYPAALSSYFLCSYRFAAAINAVALFVTTAVGSAFTSVDQMMSFITTCLVVNACAFIYAVRHQTQHDRLRKLATHDPLTGVRNRRALTTELDNAIRNGERSGMSYALVMLDLDHFKSINDTFGHHVGDRVLIQCTDILQQHIRESDQLFRFGGEEFTLLMPGVSDRGLHAVVDKLRQAIEGNLNTPDGAVTASFGVAVLRKQEPWEEWLARADQALYQAKERGRNQVVLENSFDTHPATSL